MAAPAAAEVPALAYLVLGLLGLLGFVVCRGLRGVWNVTFGVMLQGLATAITFKVLGKKFGFGGPLLALDHTVQNALLSASKKFEHSAGYFFHGVAVIQGWMARELVGLARDTLAWAQWLQRVEIPKWIKIAGTVAFPWPAIVRLVRKEIAAELPHVGRIVRSVVHTVEVHTVTRVLKATAGAIPYPPWVIRLPHRVGQLERDWTGIKRRLRKLERTAGATGAVALFVAALTKLGLKWIRCRNVTKAGKAICGTDTNLLESLLGDALLIVSAVSVVEFAKELLALEGEAVKIMGGVVREFPG